MKLPAVLKSSAKAILPEPLYRGIILYRLFDRSQKTDQQLRQTEPASLPAAYIEHLTILPTRRELLAHVPKGGVLAEVGVADGDFSRQILDICQPRKLYLIDLWDPRSERFGAGLATVQARFATEIAAGVVELRRGLSWEILGTLPDDHLDWAYLDAAHDFQSVQQDLAACQPKMKAGGTISGHDYTLWSRDGLNRWGVVEAVNRFCLENGWEFIYLTNETHRHLSYTIRPMPHPPS